MSLKLTQSEMYALADIAWFLKGYIAKQECDDPSDFGQKHWAVIDKIMGEAEVETEWKDTEAKCS